MSDVLVGTPCPDCVDGCCNMNCSSAERATGSEWVAASIWAKVFPERASADQLREWRTREAGRNLPFDCAICNAGEPEQCMSASFCQHRDGPQCEVLDEDWLADVIANSLDLDWTPRNGARAIIRALTTPAAE